MRELVSTNFSSESPELNLHVAFVSFFNIFLPESELLLTLQWLSKPSTQRLKRRPRPPIVLAPALSSSPFSLSPPSPLSLFSRAHPLSLKISYQLLSSFSIRSQSGSTMSQASGLYRRRFNWILMGSGGERDAEVKSVR